MLRWTGGQNEVSTVHCTTIVAVAVEVVVPSLTVSTATYVPAATN